MQYDFKIKKIKNCFNLRFIEGTKREKLKLFLGFFLYAFEHT